MPYLAASLIDLFTRPLSARPGVQITELLMLEALGFASPGESAALVRAGETEIGGSLPVNTGGGLIGFGHPVGATGIKQILEVCRQLRGECGEYQITNGAKYGASANLGGDDKTCVATVLRAAG